MATARMMVTRIAGLNRWWCITRTSWSGTDAWCSRQRLRSPRLACRVRCEVLTAGVPGPTGRATERGQDTRVPPVSVRRGVLAQERA
eukprot:161806-Rhodomonas_salina.4